MHLGLLIYGRLNTLSGGYLYDRQLVNYLEAAGDTVEIISLPWSRYGRHLIHNLSTTLRRRLRCASFDLLLQDELAHPSLFRLNRWLRPALAYPLISIVHHLRSSERHPARLLWLYRAVERRYLATVDGFIYNSETTRQAVESLVGERPFSERPFSERPFTIAPPAADHRQPDLDEEAITARAHEPGPLRLLFVGNLIPRKGLHTLLAALARLPRESWRLHVVGNTAVDPAYTRRIRQQVEIAALDAAITWHGPLSDADLNGLYRSSHLLAVPSRYEGFGIVYLEAMGFGLPAIASTSGAAGEIITPDQDGFLAPPGDPAPLAGHIQKLHADRPRLVQMGRAARRRYLAHPTWSDTMARTREFLLQFINH